MRSQPAPYPRQRFARPGSNARSGAVLVYGLIAVLTVGALAAASFEVVSSLSRRQARALDTKLAFYVAEAGLAEGRTGVLVGRSGAVGTEAAPAVFGDGLFWVEATPVDPDLVQLESTGMVGSGRATLSLVLKRGKPDVASLGVFSENALVVAPGSLIDWYDSSTGESAANGDVSGAGARLGSNQDVLIQGDPALPTTVIGDLVAGPGATIDVSPDATVSGSSENSLLAQVLPAVDVPKLTMRVGVTHASAVPFVVPPGEWGAQFLQVGSGANVVLAGPLTLVLGQLSLASGANLEFNTSAGPIRVVVQDSVDMAAGAQFACLAGDPRDTTIEVAGAPASPIRLLGDGPFQGVFYAPSADVVVADTFEVFGALVAGSLTFQGAPRLHFDQNLRMVPEQVVFPSVVSWRLVELASEGAVGSDPFSRYGLDSAALPRPSDAHEDVALRIEYLDSGGTKQSFDGMESAFDWSTVKEVLVATRSGSEVAPLGSTSTQLQVVDGAALLLEAEALNYISTAATSAEVKQYLLDQPRVTDTILDAAIARVPSMLSSDLSKVLQAKSPLSDGILGGTINSTLTDANLRAVLVDNSPLNPRVLESVIARVPALNAGDLALVLAAQ